MRKALFVGISAMMVGAVFAAPASAQGPSASGSCGYVAGSYGLDSLSPLDTRNPNRGLGSPSTIGTVHFQVQYSGVAPGSRLSVLRYGSLDNGVVDLSDAPTSANFTAESSGGTFAASFAIAGHTGQTTGVRSNSKSRGAFSNRGHGKQGSAPGSGTAGTGIYTFQVWSGADHIGTFRCAVS
jgi:hypothetical protein